MCCMMRPYHGKHIASTKFAGYLLYIVGNRNARLYRPTNPSTFYSFYFRFEGSFNANASGSIAAIWRKDPFGDEDYSRMRTFGQMF